MMTTTDLRVTLVQTPLHWHDPSANRRHIGQLLREHEPATDLIVLPEMFTTGFSMDAPVLAETMDGRTVNWMREQAHLYQTVITGSLIIRDGTQYFNRLIWMQPDGTCQFYDKRHLFRMAREHETYAQGQQRLTVTLQGWRICPLICYDLRFPVWSRNQDLDYDLLVYVANWPEKRCLAWKTLLAARAIENLAYVVGVNRVGDDGNGIHYSGDSVVHDPAGKCLWQQTGKAAVQTVLLSRQVLEDFRQGFPAHLDADPFQLG